MFSTGHLQKKSSRTIPVFLPEKIVGYTVTKVWIDIYCPSKASDPSTKCQTFSAKFKDIRYKNWKTTDPGHIFWHSLLWKKENGIRRKVFGTIRGTLSSWGVVELSLEIGQSHFSSWWSLFVFIDGGTKQFLGFGVWGFTHIKSMKVWFAEVT